MNANRKFSILFFGVFDPDYSRNRVLIKGLRRNGIRVVECRIDAVVNFKFIKLILRYLKMRPRYDLMLVGFPGQEVMFLARILTRKPIIFDAFTSHYGGYILDRGKYAPDSLMARYYKFLDKTSCQLANLVLLDTNAHINFFVKEFNLPIKKFVHIYVGTDSDIFYPRQATKRDSSFVVHFHGSYIPLQGVNFIIKAAKLLEDEGVTFNLIGRGQTYMSNRSLADELDLKNIHFIDPVPYSKLADYITGADVCLGIFGDTPKTKLVIPNKVFEALACARPIITADTQATRELFDDNECVLLCRGGDAEDLADKILQFKNDPNLKNKIAQNGYRLFREKLTEKNIGTQLLRILYENFSLPK